MVATSMPTHVRRRSVAFVLRVMLSVTVLGATLGGGLGAASAAWAVSSSSYFTVLPESGASEMQTPRNGAVAAPLPDGQVLIAGGENGTTAKSEPIPFQSAELFNPTTDTFTALPASGETEMHVARWRALAAPLPDGQVLIAGGNNGTGALASAELFNPTTDSFTLLPESGETEMHIARDGAVAAPLPDGQVLIASAESERMEHSAELFNPATDTFTLLPEPSETETHVGRYGAVAVSLLNGQVLIAGGRLSLEQHSRASESAELFNSATDGFMGLPEDYLGGTEMRTSRFLALAVRLGSGKILITGGESEGGVQPLSAELFNPSTDIFTALSESGETEIHNERTAAVAAPLPNGQVLIAGGRIYEGGGSALRSAELYTSAPEATVAGGEFGDQTIEEPSADQVLVMTNAGDQALVISGAALSGGFAGEYSILADGCAGRSLEPWQTCAITVRFTPSFAGNSSATLTLEDNEPSPVAITLSGTGVAPNSGPTGPQGPIGLQGAPGEPGAAGADGTQGAAGTNGSVGSQGPAGPQGPVGLQGPAGKNGEVELVTCKSLTMGAGRNKNTVQHCTIKLTSAPVTITTASASIAAVLSRGKVAYATGSATVSGKHTTLLLTPRRHIGKGTYTLTLAQGRKRQRETITID
jgi:Collagen triple helix repeat (20 copies)